MERNLGTISQYREKIWCRTSGRKSSPVYMVGRISTLSLRRTRGRTPQIQGRLLTKPLQVHNALYLWRGQCSPGSNNFLFEEQEGCRVGSRGYKEQLIINTIVVGAKEISSVAISVMPSRIPN